MKATAQLHEELVDGKVAKKEIHVSVAEELGPPGSYLMPVSKHSFTPEELRAIIQAAQPILDKLTP
jgi:hypothetical protein